MLELRDLENRSIYIIREAYAEFKNIAALWSTGKDSTTILWLCRKAFFGKIPFPVIHIDTGYKFKVMYQFRDRLAREWGFELIVARNEEAMREGMGPERGKFECCTRLKTEALKKCLEEHRFDALILAIRRDEHGIRAKERYFCFPKGTLVYGEDVKPIEEIKPGDLVYTHLGSLRRVRGVSSRPYQGDLISITPKYGLPILMTPNHVLLAKVRAKGKGRIIWIQASELKPGDRVFIPKLAKKPQDHHNAPDFVYSTSLSCSDYGKSRCGGFWVPIEKIEVVPYSGLVYDLNVEGDSSYLVQGVAVHNSPRDEDFRWNYQDQPLEMWDQFQGLVRQGTHMRVHPILHWRELDVWEYIKKEGIPVNPMYFAVEGKRYRSLGCQPCTLPIESTASTIEDIVEELRQTKIAERAGRAQDKERAFTMQKLRALGYM